MGSIALFLALVASLASAAFCAGVETGFLSVGRERVLHLAKAGGRRARVVHRALADMPRTMTTLLIGNNLANVVFSSASAALAAEAFPGSRALRMAWSAVAALTVLVAAEFLPKMLCAARPLKSVLAAAYAYRWLERALKPLTYAGMAVTAAFVPKRESKYRLTSADLMRILQDRKDGVCLSDFESALIGRIIVLRVKGRPVTPDAILDVFR